jgi:hypothetical protein
MQRSSGKNTTNVAPFRIQRLDGPPVTRSNDLSHRQEIDNDLDACYLAVNVRRRVVV